jgi:hypothetical protein
LTPRARRWIYQVARPVLEVIANRIVAAAHAGERDPVRLQAGALAGIPPRRKTVTALPATIARDRLLVLRHGSHHVSKRAANSVELVWLFDPENVAVASGNPIVIRGRCEDERNVTSGQSIGDGKTPLPAQFDVKDRIIRIRRIEDV